MSGKKRAGSESGRYRLGMTPTEDELAEAAVVDEDLAYLMDEWQPQLRQAEIRRLSPVLRRLLVDGQYGRAWRSLGLPGEPYVTATDLDAALGTIDRRLIGLACAPPGWTVSRIMVAGGQMQLAVGNLEKGSVVGLMPGYDAGLGPIFFAIPPADVTLLAAVDGEAAVRQVAAGMGRRVARGIGLTAYLRSPAVLFSQDAVTRQDVILYVANKLGGAHFDPKRQGEIGRRLAVLDSNLATYHPTGRPAATFAYAELLSAAEALAESGDAARFRNAFGKFQRETAASSASSDD